MSSPIHARRSGRPRQPVTRDHLIAAATEAFAAKGYAGTSMTEVAQQAGLRKSSLFHHFDSKEALYSETVGTVSKALSHLVLRAATSGALDPLAQLDRLGDAICRYLGAHPAAARLLLREVVDQGPLVRDGGVAMQVMEGASKLLGQAIARHGKDPRLDPHHAAMSILGLHLTWFAADAISGHLTGETVEDPGSVARRSRQIQLQVRGMCGLPTDLESLASAEAGT